MLLCRCPTQIPGMTYRTVEQSKLFHTASAFSLAPFVWSYITQLPNTHSWINMACTTPVPPFGRANGTNASCRCRVVWLQIRMRLLFLWDGVGFPRLEAISNTYQFEALQLWWVVQWQGMLGSCFSHKQMHRSGQNIWILLPASN